MGSGGSFPRRNFPRTVSPTDFSLLKNGKTALMIYERVVKEATLYHTHSLLGIFFWW